MQLILTSGHIPIKASAWLKNSSFNDMTIVCNVFVVLWIYDATFPIFVLSNAASISSSTKNGAGWKLQKDIHVYS